MHDPDPILTADDVIRAGACTDGVYRAVRRLGDKIAAAMSLSAVVRLLTLGEREYALRAAEMDGYGDGDGSGDGSGDGYGDGSGYGSGYGGYGSGGYGDGDGYGGYGDDGDGSGCDDDGYGSGYGGDGREDDG